jgi:hypothetical protein
MVYIHINITRYTNRKRKKLLSREWAKIWFREKRGKEKGRYNYTHEMI